MATYKAEFLSHHYAGPAAPAGRLRHWAGCRPLRAAVSRARLAPPVNALSHAVGPSRGSRPGWPGLGGPRHPAVRHADASSSGGGDRAGRPPPGGGDPRDGAAVARHLHQLPSHPQIGRAAVGCSRTPAGQVAMPDQAAVLRPDLDLDGTAAHRQARPAPHRRARSPPHVRAGGSWSAWSPAAPPSSAPTPRDLLPGDQDVAAARATHTVTLAELLTRAHRPDGSRRGSAASRASGRLAQVHCHQHAVLGWDADQELLEARRRRRRAAGLGLLRAGRQLRLHRRPRRGEPGLRRAGPAARGPRGGPRHRRPRRRLLLPHPDPRVRQRRPRGRCTWPSCWPPAGHVRPTATAPSRPRTTTEGEET